MNYTRIISNIKKGVKEGKGAMAVMASMYVCMGKFQELNGYGIQETCAIDFVAVTDEQVLKVVNKECKLKEMNVALKGKLGEQTSLKGLMLAEPEIEPKGFGSVVIKIEWKGVNHSLTIFNPTGKWKLCGGIPKTVTDDIELREHIETFMGIIEKWFSLDIEAGTTEIVNLVGKINLGKNKRIRDSLKECESYYDKILSPDMENKGRRNAWKLYKQISGKGKQQVTIGTEGKGQIFGCKSFAQLEWVARGITRAWDV